MKERGTSREGSSTPCRHRQHSDFGPRVAPALGPVLARIVGWRSAPRGNAFFDHPPAPRRSPRESIRDENGVSSHVNALTKSKRSHGRIARCWPHESFDELLRELAETARAHTNCEEVVITVAARGSGNTSTRHMVVGRTWGRRTRSRSAALACDAVLTDGARDSRHELLQEQRTGKVHR